MTQVGRGKGAIIHANIKTKEGRRICIFFFNSSDRVLCHPRTHNKEDDEQVSISSPLRAKEKKKKIGSLRIIFRLDLE
jgi:hypothetical protein